MSSKVTPEFCAKVSSAFDKLSDSLYGGSKDVYPGIISAESRAMTIHLPKMDFDVWVEHDAHVRFQLLPPEKRMDFSVVIPQEISHLFESPTHFVGLQLERCIKREFPNFKVQASVTGLLYGERIARNNDINQKGMTMFDVTIFNSNQDEYLDRLARSITHLSKVLNGTERPLES